MSNFCIVTQSSEARTVEQTQDKLLGYPAKGVHVGGGIHVDMPDTWDGQGSPPPGWTSYRGSALEHPEKDEWAVPLDREVPAALANGRRERLTAQEQARMEQDLQAAVETLPDGWLPATAQATKPVESQRGGRS